MAGGVSPRTSERKHLPISIFRQYRIALLIFQGNGGTGKH
jgi:hypothetical protein